MPTNIEKLAEELNALTDYDPMALECTEATISQMPGERCIYLQSFMEAAVFRIAFDEILPYDPSGAPGTTNDVFAGARISLNIAHGVGDPLLPSREEAEKFAPGYLEMVRFALHRAAKAGRISSKILADSFSKSEIGQRARERKTSVKKIKEEKAEFLNSLDPATRRAIEKAGKEIRAARKAAGKK